MYFLFVIDNPKRVILMIFSDLLKVSLDCSPAQFNSFFLIIVKPREEIRI